MPLQTPSQFVADFVGGFSGKIPIFANGLQIGYANGTDLCSGKIVQTVATTVPPQNWTTKGTFWEDISVSDYCAQHGIVPSWATKNSAGQVMVAEPSGQSITLTPQADGSYALPSQAPVNWLLIGGAGAAALLILIMVMRR